MDSPYSLSPLLQILWRGRRAIGLITLLSTAAGLTVHLLKPKLYSAKVEFFLRSPLAADPATLYNSDGRTMDYFASDEDVERMRGLIWTDSVQDILVREGKLAEAAGVDLRDPVEAKALKKSVSQRLNLYRTESKVAILSYQDQSEARAARLAMRTVQLLEAQLRRYYTDARSDVHQTILAKIREEDSSIAALTDTLTALRELYGIYDIISPARYNLMLSAMKPTGKPGYARGVEAIQNVEAVKDQIVSDRSRHISLAGQYATHDRVNDLPITQILKVDMPPLKRSGPGMFVTGLASACVGLLFGMLYVLAAHRYRGITEVR